MNYEFVYEEDFLIIKLSGSAEVNERLARQRDLYLVTFNNHTKK